MARIKYLKKIRELLQKAERAKEVKDKISQLVLVKVLVEEDLERLRKERDTKLAAYDKKTQIIKRALKQFLSALNRIYKKHEELGDTAVRDKMFAAVAKGFIEPMRAYQLPTQFGMFSEEANVLVRAAVQGFLEHPEVVAAKKVLKNTEDRLNAFQDYKVETSEGTNFFEYFGSRNKGALARVLQRER